MDVIERSRHEERDVGAGALSHSLRIARELVILSTQLAKLFFRDRIEERVGPQAPSPGCAGTVWGHRGRLAVASDNPCEHPAARFIHDARESVPMLNDRFLHRIEEQFPFFYERVAEQAAQDAARIRASVGGDIEKALVRARFESAGRLWWPYVKGTVGKDRDAMEAFTRLVLTVDRLSGYEPASMDEARRQVVSVLHDSLDVERLRRALSKPKTEGAAGAAAGAAGLMASAAALIAPISAVRKVITWTRWMPKSFLIAVGAIAAAAVLSIPFVAGYSAGHHAERAARDVNGAAPTDGARDISRAA
jgi:hypothetical protein